jgi:hypothetical protein
VHIRGIIVVPAKEIEIEVIIVLQFRHRRVMMMNSATARNGVTHIAEQYAENDAGQMLRVEI